MAFFQSQHCINKNWYRFFPHPALEWQHGPPCSIAIIATGNEVFLSVVIFVLVQVVNNNSGPGKHLVAPKARLFTRPQHFKQNLAMLKDVSARIS